MTTEMGKTFRSADEAAKCAWVCRYYAENAERFLRRSGRDDGEPELHPLSAARAVLAVMPWIFRLASAAIRAPALMPERWTPEARLDVPQSAWRLRTSSGGRVSRRSFPTLLIGSQRVDRILEIRE